MVSEAIIWGGAGLCRVVRPMLARSGVRVVGIFDNGPLQESPFPDVPFLGGANRFQLVHSKYVGAGFVVAIGGTHGRVREKLGLSLVSRGLIPLNLIHERAYVADTVRICEGSLVLCMSNINENVSVGAYSIINISATIDHECMIGSGVHIMPGATLAGCVVVEDFASVGTNATILPRVKIGAGAIVGAGAVVTKDVAAGIVVVGCPARPISELSSSKHGES